jgi:hypothetical protein
MNTHSEWFQQDRNNTVFDHIIPYVIMKEKFQRAYLVVRFFGLIVTMRYSKSLLVHNPRSFYAH